MLSLPQKFTALGGCLLAGLLFGAWLAPAAVAAEAAKPTQTLRDVESLAEGPRTLDEYDEEERIMREQAEHQESREPASPAPVPAANAMTKGEIPNPLNADPDSLFARVHDTIARHR